MQCDVCVNKVEKVGMGVRADLNWLWIPARLAKDLLRRDQINIYLDPRLEVIYCTLSLKVLAILI
jgi:hypothetical protein